MHGKTIFLYFTFFLSDFKSSAEHPAFVLRHGSVGRKRGFFTVFVVLVGHSARQDAAVLRPFHGKLGKRPVRSGFFVGFDRPFPLRRGRIVRVQITVQRDVEPVGFLLRRRFQRQAVFFPVSHPQALPHKGNGPQVFFRQSGFSVVVESQRRAGLIQQDTDFLLS